MKTDFVIKYLIGGYGALGKVLEDHVSGNSSEDVIERFWRKYEDFLDCVKPEILGLYIHERGDTRPVWERRKVELTKAQRHGR